MGLLSVKTLIGIPKIGKFAVAYTFALVLALAG